MTRVVLLALVLMALLAKADNFYVSSRGNDARDGRSEETAWRTLKRLSRSLSAGDSAFLERGSIFHEELTIDAPGIVIGAYGKGSKPIITGATTVSGWKLFRKNIWSAWCEECDADPANLFIAGKPQRLGRYPNSGYLSVSASANPTVFSDARSKFADGYWDHAEAVVRSSRWTLDRLEVASYRSKTFDCPAAASYPLKSGFGYFLQKHIATLDQNGEWYFDPEKKQIFLFLDAGTNPNERLIEVSRRETGITATNVENLTVRDISLTQQQGSAAVFIDCPGLEVKGLSIRYPGENGLVIQGCRQPKVEDNVIYGALNNGVEWANNGGGSFTNNKVTLVGAIAGRAQSGNGTAIGVYATSDGSAEGETFFRYNTLDSIGYSGFDFRTGRTFLRNNLIKHFCMVKDDGAGIYTWNNTKGGNYIEQNIITKGIGNAEGAEHADEHYTSGIYVDDRSGGITISGNTISECPIAGIYLHNARDITMTGNTLFNNAASVANPERGQLYIRLDELGQWTGPKMLRLDVSHNKWIATDESSNCVFVSIEHSIDMYQLGVFQHNQFLAGCAVQSVAVATRDRGFCQVPRPYTLKEWQDSVHYEVGSSFHALDIPHGTLRPGTINLGSWVSWPDNSAISRVPATEQPDTYIKLTIPDRRDALLYRGSFALNHEKFYRLEFKAKSTSAASLEFAPLLAESPWAALDGYACFPLDNNYHTFVYYFQPESSAANARLNFKSTQTFWIGHVSLQEVTVNEVTHPNVMLILNESRKERSVQLPSGFSPLQKQEPGNVRVAGYNSEVLVRKK